MRKDCKLKRMSFTYDGKRYDVYGNTKSDLIRKKTEKIESLKRNEVLICSSMLVRDWANQAVETYKTNLSPNALKNYKYMMNAHVLSELGDMKLKDVKPLHCQKCLNLCEDMAQKTINDIYQIMRFIFSTAVDNALINVSPAAKITKPKGKAYKHRRSLTAYEEGIFLEAIKEHQHGLLFALMWGCGCRPSEAMNVDGRDISYKEGKPFLHIRGTKTVNSDRYVPIPQLVMDMLPDRIEPFMPLVKTSADHRLNAQSTKRAWASLERIMNIKMGCKVYRNELIPPFPLAPDLVPYCLRHTFCTNLAKRGVDIRTAQALMGHADIKMTSNIYTHVDDGMLVDQFDLITNNHKSSRTLMAAI